MGFHLFALGKAADDLSAEGRLTGADVTDDDVQAPSQVQRELQLLKAIQMLPGVVEIIGVRRIGERFTVQIEDGEVVHEKCL